MCDIGEDMYNFQKEYCEKIYTLLRKYNAFATQGKSIKTIDDIVNEKLGDIWHFSKNNIYAGHIMIDYKTGNFSIICKLDNLYTKNSMVDKIAKRFKLNELEKDTFTNYVEYMNDESREPFLQKVYKNDRKYLQQFLETDFEDIGEEVFGESIDYSNTRKNHKDMYNLLDEDQGGHRLLLYKGVISKLSKLDSDERRGIYKTYFNVTELPKNVEQSRQKVYDGFIGYLKGLNKKRLHRFIDDVFDRKIKELDFSG